MNTKTVLIVDDDNDIRDMLKEALELEGYQVRTAVNGLDALHFLTQKFEKINCILLDLMMPKMNGKELLTELQTSHPDLAEIPVILLTANGKSTLDNLVPYASAKIKKPMELDVLYQTIKTCLI